MTRAFEVNFDGLVGPTHNYAGLSHGNIASEKHAGQVAHPRAAAVEGLAKMKRLHDLGVKQAVLPPHDRPNMPLLRALGFSGDDAAVLSKAAREAPHLLAAACSASAMWTANAATVSPSADSADGRVHFTVANLIGNVHRAIEANITAQMLRRVFADESAFAHHGPLPCTVQLGDEGAANHTRLCLRHDRPGVELFTYGRRGEADAGPRRFPARQTLEASQAIARLHQLDANATLFVQQTSEAIDAGVFHNDVIAVGHRNVFLCHERAYFDQRAFLDMLRQTFTVVCEPENEREELQIIEVGDYEVPLADAVASYLFNSQLVTLPDGSMALIYPIECDEIESTRQYLAQLAQGDTPIRAMHSVNLRQSMRNGGGPACLRLRIALTEHELAEVHSGVLFTDDLHAKLIAWVNKHYRETLALEDLHDPALLRESRDALDELMTILGLPALYAFAR